MAICRNSILMLSVALKKNTERNFYSEKSNYISGCSEAAVQNHPFLKISPENIGCRIFLLVKLQTGYLQ